MSHYKPYPAYRDSGVEWIGQVPEHWKKLPFKRMATICNGRDYKEVENPDGVYPVIGSGGEFSRASDFMFDGESVLLGRKGTIDKPLYINGPFWAVDRACKNFCVNGHLAGNCRAPRSDDGRSKESSTEGVAGQPAG